jgi:hypothetical protein
MSKMQALFGQVSILVLLVMKKLSHNSSEVRFPVNLFYILNLCFDTHF